MSSFPLFHRRRYPVRVILLTLIVGLLVATVATVGGVAYVSLKGAIDELSSHRFAEISGAAADKVRNLLEPANDILMECQTLASRGLLPVDDQDALGERLVERLRYNPKLTWLSYSGRDGRFTGAHRADNGNILLNRSWITPRGVSMLEQIMSVGGVRVLARSSDDWKYDPRTQKFYQLASAQPDQPVWTEPYPWYDAEGRGITCALALRDGHGVRGVFTADFRLDRLAAFLRTLRIGQTGRVAVLTLDGTVIADPSARPATGDQRDPLLTAALASLPKDLPSQGAGQTPRTSFEFDGETHLAAFETFSMPGGDLNWATVIVVPERELLGSVRRSTAWTILIGLLSLTAAVVLGNILCARFARPLQQISADLARVGHFDLSADPLTTSNVKEIAIVSEATTRMKASLRSFGRYVPTDVVRELVALGEEAKLGAQAREITIFFSDVEGFTKISESMHPQQLVEAMGVYFDAMAHVLAWQQGTLDKFIGDGILAFFNAPAPLPDHAARACRAALACQSEITRLRPRWQANGWPPFHTRIGLHTAEVLVGNIGTPSRFAYTVIGDGVNLASGLETLNKVYGTSILASEGTRDAAGADFEWRRVDRVAVKGRAGVGFAYELLGERVGISADLLRSRDLYEQAADAYARREFGTAVELFEQSMSLRPADRAAETMLSRARRLLLTPPNDEWENIYTHAPE